MNGIERVGKTIKREKADRVPLYGWVRANLSDQITEAFGSVEAFEDKYEFDLSHVFGGPSCYGADLVDEVRKRKGGDLEPADLLELPMTDPADQSAYKDIIAELKHHRTERQRFCYVQTPGIFEANNGHFGIENHLAYLLLFPEDLAKVYARQAEWNRRFADACIDLGVDMVHVSDDWGSQKSLLFSPDLWWSMIYPYHKTTVDHVKKRGCFASVHSDGDVSSVLGGVRQLGYDVVHPFQETGDMSYDLWRREYRNDFTVMGGMDVQTTIGFGDPQRAKREIARVLDAFKEGGLLLCTTHYIQDHCTMEELREIFDYAYRAVRGKR